jgi:hypothetical protein
VTEACRPGLVVVDVVAIVFVGTAGEQSIDGFIDADYSLFITTAIN